MDEKYISVTKFKESLAKLTVEGGTEATRAPIARTLGKVVPQLLDDELSADVQPVKHGRWIPQGNDMWLCSNCKENIIYSMSESDRTEKQRYCCRCGTRMDLKDGDAE